MRRFLDEDTRRYELDFGLIVYPERIGLGTNGHSEIDEDEVLGFLAGPAV
jgi:hypothetical protein